MSGRESKAVGFWLLGCAVLVASVLVLGGWTRLTHSGLSIVHWELIRGIWPPVSDAQWGAELRAYQASPEYQLINQGMSLEAFQRIYWMEYAHRLLARLLGLAFLLPGIYFWLRGRIPVRQRPILWAILVAGLLQGLFGWLMVKSGLVSMPRVDPLRLMLHLGMGLLLFGMLIWGALGTLVPEPARPSARWSRAGSTLLVGLVGLTALYGALVAGLHAGYLFNTFPTMDGRWIPEGFWELDPAWRNFIANPATVQFTHRILALTTFGLGMGVAMLALRTDSRRWGWPAALVGAVLLQASLGLATLLLGVPRLVASLHQLGALLLLTVALFGAYHARGRPTL